MQASKTEQDETRFDCLTCLTSILERPVSAPGQGKEQKAPEGRAPDPNSSNVPA
jgi:hypothetical protein